MNPQTIELACASVSLTANATSLTACVVTVRYFEKNADVQFALSLLCMMQMARFRASQSTFLLRSQNFFRLKQDFFEKKCSILFQFLNFGAIIIK